MFSVLQLLVPKDGLDQKLLQLLVQFSMMQKEAVQLIHVCQSNWHPVLIKISPTLASAWCYCVEWNGIGGSINDSPSPP